jgi:D-alanyl-D-alanine carboxypeptidase
MNKWPLQRECDEFYGNPRGINGGPSLKWEREKLVLVAPPFEMYFLNRRVKGLRVHFKCADSLRTILGTIWTAAGHRQEIIDLWGVSTYGGGYNYRLMRGGNQLSMHSYGCAIDLDPGRNGLGDTTPHFENLPMVVDAFEKEGWIWGGRWGGRYCDGMHFQAAKVS